MLDSQTKSCFKKQWLLILKGPFLIYQPILLWRISHFQLSIVHCRIIVYSKDLKKYKIPWSTVRVLYRLIVSYERRHAVRYRQQRRDFTSFFEPFPFAWKLPLSLKNQSKKIQTPTLIWKRKTEKKVVPNTHISQVQRISFVIW